ncbi:acyl carrier protein [Prochlorococcus marinus]|uniref:acyl carrier protein n=1 Tax=Prochlorococcus marinus TaxID=1219 RepID=UPI0022B54C90|nr:acyl carrier protein [Prochlorococcus marinus]
MTLVIKDILDLETLDLEKTMTAEDIDGWDSLAHISIVVAMEKEFKCSFSLGEIKKLNNIGDFVSLVLTKN